MKTLLVINDDPVQLHLLASLLRQDGHHVVSYASSEAAWQWIYEGHVPDGIVLDLHMPGISGWRFCELLQTHFRSRKGIPPVLAVSATYSGQDAEQVLADLGAAAFLSLPADPSSIRQLVSQLVEQKFHSKALHVWVVSSHESQVQRIRYVFQERGWKVFWMANGEQTRMTDPHPVPDIIIVDDPLPDINGRDLIQWCRRALPNAMCVLLESRTGGGSQFLQVSEGELVLNKGCDPNTLLSLCEKGRWERVLTRVEHLLESRTSDLRESEAQFQGLFEILPDILVIYDGKGVIRHINAAGAKLLQCSPADLIGQPLQILYPDRKASGNRHETDPGRVGASAWQEAALSGKEGIQLWCEIFERPVRFAGQPHALLIARDLTDRKRMEIEKGKLEEQLRQVQKMEAVGRLAAGVAHDMNNIMTAILGHASLLKIRSHADEQAWKVGAIIEKAVHRGRELTSQLLGFARQGKYHHLPIDLHEVVKEVVSLLGRTMDKSITFQMELNADQPWTFGDQSQIFQVFMNLSVNACDAMNKEGELRFLTTNESITPEQASRVPGLSAGEYVVVRVTDTGEGISPDVQGKIFEPFFSTKESGKGSGMGLAMVYGIVKNHRGYIGVTSLLGVGTTMKVYLPTSSCPPAKPASKQKTSLSKGTGHILVVDDEQEVAQATQAVLEHLGYEVRVALNGKEALAYCQEPGKPVDIVWLDMMMPDMSGAECFAQLKALLPDAKVVLCTGYDRNHAVQDLLDQGVVAFIQKPYDIDHIAKVCAELSQPADPVSS